MDAASLAVLSGPQLCSGRRMHELSLLSRGPWDMGRTGEFGETPVNQLQAVNLPSNPRIFFMVIFTKPSRNHLLVGDQSPNTVYGELGQLQNVSNQKRGQTSEFLLLPRSTLCFADGGGTRAGLTSET